MDLWLRLAGPSVPGRYLRQNVRDDRGWLKRKSETDVEQYQRDALVRELVDVLKVRQTQLLEAKSLDGLTDDAIDAILAINEFPWEVL